MASTRTTFTLDASLAQRARELGISLSAAARDGVEAAVAAAIAQAERAAYERQPERPDTFWTQAEAWSDE
ncbi:MAG TPA: type II toxin-antitoxin system CcdA family antitoxin [Gaiella sp.]|jgi:post-segregation antitoxin (ccd killing protein)|nr:type II toxin-antitoxin system CcdA family antitoxin [Gaiella sp.]